MSVCVYMNTHAVCVYLYVYSAFGQSAISPSVETRLWRKVRSVISVTTTRISAATALKSMSGSSVTLSLVKSAGNVHVQLYTT